nr:uncharacterized protein LOC112060216 [Chrysemys picta bellii]
MEERVYRAVSGGRIALQRRQYSASCREFSVRCPRLQLRSLSAATCSVWLAAYGLFVLSQVPSGSPGPPRPRPLGSAPAGAPKASSALSVVRAPRSCSATCSQPLPKSAVRGALVSARVPFAPSGFPRHMSHCSLIMGSQCCSSRRARKSGKQFVALFKRRDLSFVPARLPRESLCPHHSRTQTPGSSQCLKPHKCHVNLGLLYAMGMSTLQE